DCRPDAYVAGCGGGDAARGTIEAEEAAERDGTGEPMKNQDEILLDEATRAMRAAGPDANELSASAEKVAGRLGIAFAEIPMRSRVARICGRCSMRIARVRYR